MSLEESEEHGVLDWVGESVPRNRTSDTTCPSVLCIGEGGGA